MSSLAFSLLLSSAIAASSIKAPAHYKFSYHVKDQLSGQDFGQAEERSGYNTGGEYRVSLPDGRKQIVTYTVTDQASGYVADGEAKYDSSPEELASPSPPPPIRVMPSLPRTDQLPTSTRRLTQEEERFFARPTKIVPSIIKVKSSESPAGKYRTSKPTNLVPRTSKPSLKPTNIKKPISAFKSVAPQDDEEEPPVYIPRDPPTMSYKRRYKMRPSQGLNSLFREDTDDMVAEPRTKN